MPSWMDDLLKIFSSALLLLINGFFVSAEFALVKIRESRLDALVKAGRPFSPTAKWLVRRLDTSLSACQLGITWHRSAWSVGEGAFSLLATVVLDFDLQAQTDTRGNDSIHIRLSLP